MLFVVDTEAGGCAEAPGASRHPSLGWRTALHVEPLDDEVGLRVIGEVDPSTRGDWQGALSPLVRQGTDVHLELSGLVFADAGGVAVLVTAARSLTSGRRMVLHDPPVTLTRTLERLFPSAPEVDVRIG